MCYLKRTENYMLAYILEIIRYSDSDFEGCLNSRDSILGYIFNHDGGVNILLRDIKSYDMIAKFCY